MYLFTYLLRYLLVYLPPYLSINLQHQHRVRASQTAQTGRLYCLFAIFFSFPCQSGRKRKKLFWPTIRQCLILSNVSFQLSFPVPNFSSHFPALARGGGLRLHVLRSLCYPLAVTQFCSSDIHFVTAGYWILRENSTLGLLPFGGM
jgi:hypothetical protein